jgi:hypothetical protein
MYSDTKTETSTAPLDPGAVVVQSELVVGRLLHDGGAGGHGGGSGGGEGEGGGDGDGGFGGGLHGPHTAWSVTMRLHLVIYRALALHYQPVMPTRQARELVESAGSVHDDAVEGVPT